MNFSFKDDMRKSIRELGGVHGPKQPYRATKRVGRFDISNQNMTHTGLNKPKTKRYEWRSEKKARKRWVICRSHWSKANLYTMTRVNKDEKRAQRPRVHRQVWPIKVKYIKLNREKEKVIIQTTFCLRPHLITTLTSPTLLTPCFSARHPRPHHTIVLTARCLVIALRQQHTCLHGQRQ